MTNTEFSAKELFNHLLKVIASQRFLKMQGLNQEVPFFLCPFSVKLKQEIEQMIPQLKRHLANKEIGVVEINLYDLCIKLLKTEGVFDQLLEIESDTDKGYFLESLQSMLDVETHIVPAIERIINEQKKIDILFLTGVGEVFPYIRTHNILNNLQRVAKQFPSVLFFPGEYTHSLEKGATLRLFGELPDDKYYRAYDITHYKN
ncbi:MAG: DUF1788 domain-containing protein [Alphaproteobacteria bacterium]|nr:DUF1788 domain-containing protein [Alphaproteobacteria bacterium]